MHDLGHTAAFLSIAATRIERGHASHVDEVLAEETPVSMAYNGAAHAVMMATPSDLEDFAYGFSLTEGIIQRTDELTAVGTVKYSRGIELQMETSRPVAPDRRVRRLSGRTGCGICGKEDIEQVLREIPHVSSGRRFEPAAIVRAMESMTRQQPLNAATGAMHAAAWADGNGVVSFVREDVGRHNALDKVIGAVTRAGTAGPSGFVLLTSRGSFELVQKAAVLGVGLIATVSAPTALAARMAHDLGITLAGFARDQRVTVYTHAHRVV
ncbi:MAG: formate dehydrogenase accessory sulfurtransferase FdhD [bacterium]